MPFKKVGSDDYTGPSGKHFNLNQVRRYYARGGHFAAGGTVKEPSMARSKSYGTFNAAYAAGGPVLGRSRSFLKETVEFRDPDEGRDAHATKGAPPVVGDMSDEDNRYGKSGAGAGRGQGPGPSAKRTGDKSLKVVKPRG